MRFAGMTLMQVTKLPGVADLPLRVRAAFAKALIAEDNGDHITANQQLNEAVALEEAHLAAQ